MSEVKRTELATVLKQVAPALANRDLVPVFSCFCFDGQHVTAYDDMVAMRTKCKLPVKGGVPGAVLLGLLSATKVAKVDITTEGDTFMLKAGRSKQKLAMLGPDAFLFDMPTKKRMAFDNTKPLLDAIAQCLPTMGTDPNTPDLVGITLSYKDGAATLYSTTRITGTRVSVKVKCVAAKATAMHTILSPRFSELLVSTSNRDGCKSLLFGGGCVTATFMSGLVLVSKCLVAQDTSIYVKAFEAADSKTMAKRLLPIPKGVGRALERAAVLLATDKEAKTELRVEDGRLKLTTITPTGQVVDMYKVGGKYDEHGSLRPDRLAGALTTADTFALHQNTLCLHGSGYVYIAATSKD